ncbi:MAG: hypothetical protein KKG75_01845, partial [Nanoarchaeota archaeon]|nr:hypothetical protein [Nanoarchaeota archaeon]
MLNIKKTLILLVISLFFLVLITPKVYSVVAEECNPATGPGYQIGFAEDAICFYCYENDGLCLDIEFKDSWCISNNAYDPDCYYPIQATQSEKYSYWYDSINQKLWWIPYDFCGDGIDNDGDGAIDFADGECDENLQTPTYSPPGTVLEGTQITVSCPFLPLVNGVSFTDYTFSQQPTKRPTVNAYMITTSCGNPIGWSGNTAQFTCNAAGGQLACHSNQLGDSESTISSVSVSYLSCAAKGGALTRPAGYMCDTVPASDGTCYVNCVKDLRDPDGDGLTTFEEETAGADGFITNPNNPDTDGDGISDGPLAPVGSGLIPGPDPAPNVADEVCTSAGDEDGNGESDYDSIDGKHGDITCPVSITSITSSKTTVDNGETFTVSCGSSIANINSISATLGGRTCTFTNWVGSTANFACTATSTCPTTETARCFVDTLKSYATAPTEKTATITVKCSSCSAYILTTSCTTDTRCEWCLECGGTNKYRGADGNICVATGTCSYSCRKDKCNAVCDNTNGGWINYLCDNYCSGNNLYIRSDVNNFCYDGISPDNCLASTYTCTTGVAQSCGITPCDAAKNLVGSCNNPCVNIGTATDGTDAYCGACTPTCSCAAGYYDINQNMADGCEYACTISNGGIEICDNKDNNCNGQIDEQLTQQCGATDAGECSYGIETCSAGAWTGCTAITPQTEICTDLKDNDCDSLSDYDTKQDLDMQFRHGDDNCPVSITAISLSTATIRAGADTFNIECTVSPSTPGLNSIFAYIDKDGNGVYNSGDLDLGWQAGDVYASGKYYFNSRTISTSGTYKINCGVYSSGTEPFDRSYQSGADQTATITVIPSICSDRTQTSCSFGGDCKWVPQCDSSSPKYTGDIGRCVETATVITESCSVPICSEQCDGSNLLNVCTATSQCVSKVYQLRTPSCSSTCLCSYSTWVTQACNTAYCTADCNAGFKQDTGVDYCNTNLGDIYNRWEGCSSLCTITDAAEADVIKEDCVNTCTDTDGGQVYTTQGTVTDKNLCSSSSQITCPATIIKTDSCSGTTLTEYFCNGNDNSYTNYNCNNLDSVTPNSGTDTCIWSDYGCSTGACSLTSSGNVNCDSYDDIDGSDGVIKDYETDATKCILGCTTTSCCLAPLTYTSDGLCGTKTIEGINYIAYNDGANKWGTLSTVNAVKEICNDGKDNNCNGFIDSKDPACVIVTSINSLDTVTQIDQSFEVKCGTTIDSNCMGLTISAGSCVFDETKGTAGWDLTNPNEPKAIFSCTASAAGSINLNCYISNNQDGSCTVGGITATPTPSNIGKTITAIASACGSRVIGDCPFDGKCEWCPTCGSLDNT